MIDEVHAGDEDSDFLADVREELSVAEIDSDPEDEILDRVDYGEAHALHAAIAEDGTLRPTISGLGNRLISRGFQSPVRSVCWFD